MSYLNQAQDPRRRATALAGTAAIHIVLGIGIVTGLTIGGYTPFDEYKPIIEITPDPLPEPPPPEPKQQQEAQETFVTVPPTPYPPTVPTDDWVRVDPVPDDTLVVERGPVIVPTIEPPVRPAFAPRKARPSNNPSRWITTAFTRRLLLRGGKFAKADSAG